MSNASTALSDTSLKACISVSYIGRILIYSSASVMSFLAELRNVATIRCRL